MKIRDRVKQLKKDIPVVFLAIRKKETPWYAKIFAFLAVAYALSPIDLIPDFIPILGYLDDVIILPLLIVIALMFVPKETIEQCRIESNELWENGKPKKVYYAIPIVLMWIIIIVLVIKAFL